MTLKEFRLNRIKTVAEADCADIVVASLPENISYLTGGYVSVNQMVLTSAQSYIVYCPRNDRLIYVIGHAEIPSVLEFTDGRADIISYGGFRFMYNQSFPDRKRYDDFDNNCCNGAAEALISAINSLREPGDVIALDYMRMPYTTVDRLIREIEGADYKDAKKVFDHARMIKHPEEIAGIEASAELAEQGLLYALDHFRPGDTEQSLEASFKKFLGMHGAKYIFFVATSNKRAAFSDTCNMPVPINYGSHIRFDFGCEYKGYCSDLARTAVVGEPDEKVTRLYKAILDGTEAAIKIARPGVRASDLFNAAVETTRASGIPDYYRHHTGHGIGLEVYDIPSVAANDDTALEEGMVINIETPYYELGWGGVQVEDTIAVTKDGCRRLDKTGNRLIILK